MSSNQTKARSLFEELSIQVKDFSFVDRTKKRFIAYLANISEEDFRDLLRDFSEEKRLEVFLKWKLGKVDSLWENLSLQQILLFIKNHEEVL